MCNVVQGCVEIIYISVQVVMYTMIVYWMCWFQRDAGQHIPCLPLLLCASLLLVAAADVCFARGTVKFATGCHDSLLLFICDRPGVQGIP